MDGTMKAFSELEFLSRKKPFVVPNPILNLQQIISKTGEGNMGEMVSKERNKFKSNMARELSDVLFLIDAKKSKLRTFYA